MDWLTSFGAAPRSLRGCPSPLRRTERSDISRHDSIAGPAERFEQITVPVNERFLLGPAPAYQLTLTLNGCAWSEGAFAINEFWACVIMGVLALQPKTVFSQPFANVVGLPYVERAVLGFQEIDECLPFDRLRAFDFAQDATIMRWI